MADSSFMPGADPPILSTFIKLAIPAILTNLLIVVSNMVLIVYAGMLDDPKYLAVVGLTFTCGNMMIMSLMIGLNSAQETLSSQAYGAGNY